MWCPYRLRRCDPSGSALTARGRFRFWRQRRNDGLSDTYRTQGHRAKLDLRSCDSRAPLLLQGVKAEVKQAVEHVLQGRAEPDRLLDGQALAFDAFEQLGTQADRDDLPAVRQLLRGAHSITARSACRRVSSWQSMYLDIAESLRHPPSAFVAT